MTSETHARPVTVPAGYRVDRWRVGELLGDGGWGSVYAGEPAQSDDDDPVEDDAAEEADPVEPVALKFLPPAMAPAQRSLLGEIVERESEFSRLADHANLIRTRAVLTLSEPNDPNLNGAVVLVMDRAKTSLRELLVNADPGTALPEAERILVEVCRGLADMHAGGWIHGDLKPGNVLLMADGSVRLADFGLTARIEGTHAYVPRIGSSDYLPPEWWSERVGERGIPQRPSADVWAFGVLAHQVLSGGLYPFPGTNPQARAFAVQAFARGAAQLRLDDRIPVAWRELIVDCLSPDQVVRGQMAISRVLDGAEAIWQGGTYAGTGSRSGSGAGVKSGSAARSGATSSGSGSAASSSRTVPGRRRLRLLLATTGLTAVAAGLGGWWASTGESTGTSNVKSTSDVGSLSANAAVPAEYRDTITKAANLCAAPEVTPALIAGILKVESNFDPNFSSPQTASFGIAGWTPSVFHAWANAPQEDYMKPKDAIPTVAIFLCWLDHRLIDNKVPGDRNALIAAAYDTSDMAVIRANGVPASAATFASQVVKYAHEYAR